MFTNCAYEILIRISSVRKWNYLKQILKTFSIYFKIWALFEITFLIDWQKGGEIWKMWGMKKMGEIRKMWEIGNLIPTILKVHKKNEKGGAQKW